MLNYRKHNLRGAFADFLFDNDENWLILKDIPISRLECKSHSLFMTKSAKNQLKSIPYL